MSGASILQIAWRITFRLAWPVVLGSLLILFVRAIELFEVPALLGLPVGIHVYTSAIFSAIHQYPSQIGLAAAYAITLLVLCLGGIYLQSRLSYQGQRYSTVTGKGFRPRTIDLGRWRWVAASIFVIYFIVIVLLPFLVLVWTSLQKYYSAPSWQALSRISLDNYRSSSITPGFWTTVRNSLFLSLTCAVSIIITLGAVISWVVVRTNPPRRCMLDSLASMPLVFPGIVLGLSIMICYLYIDIGIYNTIWIMLVAYVTRFLPYGMRYVSTSMLQIHKELEESVAYERRLLEHELPAYRAAAAQARPAGGFHLCGDRVDPRAVELDPALQPRQRGGLDHDLGAVAERAICGVLRARRDADPAVVRAGDGRADRRPALRHC